MAHSNFTISVLNSRPARDQFLDLSIPRGILSIGDRAPFQVFLTRTFVDEKIHSAVIKATCTYQKSAPASQNYSRLSE